MTNEEAMKALGLVLNAVKNGYHCSLHDIEQAAEALSLITFALDKATKQALK